MMEMKNEFCGWYFRCQSGEKTLALIPAIHASGTSGGERTGSLQIITEGQNWNIPFSGAETALAWARPRAVVGQNYFCGRGLSLNLKTPELTAQGQLRFGPPARLGYDIMGPFCLVPGMECRHRVYSMGHTVTGALTLNGEEYRFDRGTGYIEGDQGRSFPQKYLWTQCSFPGGALMLSAAEIPLGPLRFTGVIGIVQLAGAEYRLATYLGARAGSIAGGQITVRQGALTFTAACLEETARPLRAPDSGAMTRTIRENVACRARYRLTDGDRTVLELDASRAAFEYEY